jgi:hypothetical protein
VPDVDARDVHGRAEPVRGLRDDVRIVGARRRGPEIVVDVRRDRVDTTSANEREQRERVGTAGACNEDGALEVVERGTRRERPQRALQHRALR